MLSRRLRGIDFLGFLLPRNSPRHDSDITRGLFIAMVVGVVAGFGAVLFRNLIHWIEDLAFDGGAEVFSFLGEYYIVIIPALGGLLVGPLVYFCAREAKGHGVPEVMIAVAKNGGRIRARVAAVKTLASAITIGTGGSVGREGPIVQIGATVGSTIGQRLRLPEDWIKTLVACGAAGGISATFNAPIAGVFFALEVILGSFSTRNFSVVVVSSVVAAAVSHAFFPNEANLVVPEYKLESALELPFYGVLGILAAFTGIAFVIVLYFFEDAFDRLRFPEYLKPVLGGLCVGALGLYSTDLFGVGYGALEKASNGEMMVATALVLLGLKILATSITVGSGGSGGVFAPSLFLGAVLGIAFGGIAQRFFPEIIGPVGAYAIVGMAAVFSSTSRAPITAVVILFELTRDYSIILPLMLCVVVSTVVSQLLLKDGIYTRKMRRKGVEIPGEERFDALEQVRVGDVMTKDFKSVPVDYPLDRLESRFKEAGQRGLLVVAEDGGLEGVVTVTDLESALREGSDEAARVGDIATRSVLTTYPDESLRHTLLQIGADQVGRIPVVERDDERKVAGVLRRHDIIGAYIEAARKAKR